jgi:hypothetical protein
MSFWSSVGQFVGNLFGGGNSIGSQLLNTALSAYALNRLTKSMQRDLEASLGGGAGGGAATPTVDPGVRLQLDPDTETKIPVVYGRAYISGKIIDAALSDSNKQLYVCLALCEETGNLIDGTESVISFKNIYMDGFRLNFQTSGAGAGTVVASTTDTNGAVDTRLAQRVGVLCYNGNSSKFTLPAGYTNANNYDARVNFPGWTNNHLMLGTVFAIVQIAYNPNLGLSGIPNFVFELENTLTKPGDVLYDYMTNSVYGCGIPEGDIYIQ